MLNRITPAVVWSVVAAAFIVALAERAAIVSGFWKTGYNPDFGFSLMLAAAYAVSLVFCLKIAREHQGSLAMYLAWLLFAGSSALSVIRHALLAVVASRAFPAFHGAESYMPTQIPMALALVLLFGGLLAMWSAFRSLGLGFHARRVDVVLFILMLLMLTPILARNAERIPLPWSSSVLARIVTYAGAALLPAAAGVAVLLHRIAMQMGGGEIARSLRWLICYPALRLTAMLIAVDPHLRQFTWLGVLGYAIFQIAPLIFTLALAYRWQITVKSSVAMAAGSETWKDLYPVEHAV